MKVTRLLIVTAVIGVGGAAFAQGQLSGPAVADVVKTRQQGLKALGASFKTIRDELKGEAPDAAKIRTASADITHAAAEIGKWFPAGTGPESGVKTDAKAEIWSDAPGFATARESFVREANKWTQLANNSDAAAWKDAATSLGQTCKGCHDKYRLKKE